MITTKSFTNSSQVAAIEYKKEQKEMEVLYLQGKKYSYSDVSEDIWVKALEAESIGKFINSEIKGKFNYKQI